MQPMADTVGLELADSRPYRLRPDGLAGVNGSSQTFAGSASVNLTEKAGWRLALVATQADTDDAVARLAYSEDLVQHTFGGFGTKVPDRVEDPVQRHAEIALASLAALLQTFEQRGEFAASPVDNANRHVHFDVPHPLRAQLVHHAVSDQLVIVGCTQALGDGFEGKQKSCEALVAIELACFFLGENAAAVGNVGVAIIRRGERRRMPAAELSQGSRVYGSLEMKMQLGLGQRADELAGLPVHLAPAILGAKFAAVAAVQQVDCQANQQPHEEPNPGQNWQASHQQDAEQHAQHRR